SGETLAMAGDPLQQFRIVSLGRSVCVVPIKVQTEVIGMLIVVRTEARPFGKTEQTLLEAVSDYASISLVNARLFRALTETVHSAQESEKRQNAVLETVRNTVAEELKTALYPVEVLLAGRSGQLREDQRQALQTTRTALQRLEQAAEKSVPVALKRK
ncbi:MAG TPA: GAF domain-containing protein, partial [Anaerolineales bacterium]|nr:GAF domain-containing protein [Anaerolineales bacterium]